MLSLPEVSGVPNRNRYYVIALLRRKDWELLTNSELDIGTNIRRYRVSLAKIGGCLLPAAKKKKTENIYNYTALLRREEELFIYGSFWLTGDTHCQLCARILALRNAVIFY